MSPSLPVEILESVIDQVDYDESEWETGATLRCFALTCRKLLSRSRVRLFSSICLKTRRQYLRLCDLLDSASALRPLICTVIIRTNAIRDADSEVWGMGRWNSEDVRKALSLHEIVPATLLAQLPNLRHWKQIEETNLRGSPRVLKCVAFSPIALSSLRYYTSSSSLQFLHLKTLRFLSFAEFAGYLCAFPNIQGLACNCVRVGRIQKTDPTRYGRVKQLPRLTTLDVSCSEVPR